MRRLAVLIRVRRRECDTENGDSGCRSVNQSHGRPPGDGGGKALATTSTQDVDVIDWRPGPYGHQRRRGKSRHPTPNQNREIPVNSRSGMEDPFPTDPPSVGLAIRQGALSSPHIARSLGAGLGPVVDGFGSCSCTLPPPRIPPPSSRVGTTYPFESRMPN